jgi:predicted nucleic acid-binding Zn ribbon protein
MAVYRFNKENASRRPGVKTLGEAIEAMLAAYKIERKFDQTYLSAHWERVIGKEIASRTESIYIEETTLFLRLNSSTMAQELVMAKSKLIQSLNREFGYELITDIVFM